MVKNTNQKTKKTSQVRNRSGNPGPVASVTTAPVAIGNTIRGTVAKTTSIKDGVRVSGRDFAFAVSASVAAVND